LFQMNQLTAPPTDIRLAAGRALFQLGASADDIANRLRALEIKGDTCSENTCAVAVFLGRLPGVADVDVLETHALLYPVGSATAVEVDLPAPVQVFVQHFDRGVHLDLVVDPEAAAREQLRRLENKVLARFAQELEQAAGDNRQFEHLAGSPIATAVSSSSTALTSRPDRSLRNTRPCSSGAGVSLPAATTRRAGSAPWS
jgi:hypothetical protein